MRPEHVIVIFCLPFFIVSKELLLNGTLYLPKFLNQTPLSYQCFKR